MKYQSDLYLTPHASLSSSSQPDVNWSLDGNKSPIPPCKRQDDFLQLQHDDAGSSSPLDYELPNCSTPVSSEASAAPGEVVQEVTEPYSYSDPLMSPTTSQVVNSAFAQDTWSMPLWPTSAYSSSTVWSTPSANLDPPPVRAVQQAHGYPFRPSPTRDLTYAAAQFADGEVEKDRDLSSRELRPDGNLCRQTNTQETLEQPNRMPHSTEIASGLQSPRLNGARNDKGVKRNIEKVVVGSQSAPESGLNDGETQVRHLCPHPHCDKHFSTGGHARRHSRIHSNAPRHECPHLRCPATFSRRDNCQQHQRNSHKTVLDVNHVQQV